MRWYEDKDDLTQARFRDISRPKVADLSWAHPSFGGEVVSLRPPRVPAIHQADHAHAYELELEKEPEDEISGLHPAPHKIVRASRPPLRPSRPVPSAFDEQPPSGYGSNLGSFERSPPMSFHASLRPAGLPDLEPRRMDTMIDQIVPHAEEEALLAIHGAVERAEADRQKHFGEAEQRLVDLAMLVARRVIAREVSIDPGIVRGLVREGIAALGEQDRVVVRVGTFFAEMRDHLQTQLASSKMRCEVIVDPTLGHAGCIVETELGSVDESVDARLAHLIDGLSFEGGRRKPG
jgi:hypothetical protein